MAMGTRLVRLPGQAWRVFASGVSFSIFGVVGVLVSVLLFPPLFLLPLGKERRQLWGRIIIGTCFALFTRVLHVLRLMRCDAKGTHALPEGKACVIIANHPTFIDVVYLLARFPSCICIVKPGVWNNPCMMIPVRTAGYIPNRDAEQLITDCVANLKAGKSVMIFPEGTRSQRDSLRSFQRGFAAMAVRSGCPVLPIVVTSTPPTLYKDCPWYKMADRCCDLLLQTKEPIDISPFARENRNDSLAARELTKHVEKLYTEELKGYYAGL